MHTEQQLRAYGELLLLLIPSSREKGALGGLQHDPQQPHPTQGQIQWGNGGSRAAHSSKTRRAAPGQRELLEMQPYGIHSHPGSALPACPEPPGCQHCSW